MLLLGNQRIYQENVQESVYREKSSGTDTIKHLQSKWVETKKAVTGRYSVKK